MKQSRILLTSEPVDWSLIPVLDISEKIRPLPTDTTAYGQICRTEDALLIHMAATEKTVLANEQGLLAMPCNDSCLEFFLRPCEKEMRYINFEFNPNGCLYLGIGTGPADLMRIVPSEKQQKQLFCPEVNRLPNGWEIFFRVPYSFIRGFFIDFVSSVKTVVYGNFYKCGDRTVKKHYFAWNPIVGENKSFHCPEDFGLLEFE